MITPIDEMQIREHDFRLGGNQKQLKPLDAGQGASGRVVIQQILNQIHQEFDQNQFDKMQVFQEDLKNMQQLTKQLSKGKTWKEDATHSSHQALEKESTEDAYFTTSLSNKVTTGL